MQKKLYDLAEAQAADEEKIDGLTTVAETYARLCTSARVRPLPAFSHPPSPKRFVSSLPWANPVRSLAFAGGLRRAHQGLPHVAGRRGQRAQDAVGAREGQAVRAHALGAAQPLGRRDRRCASSLLPLPPSLGVDDERRACGPGPSSLTIPLVVGAPSLLPLLPARRPRPRAGRQLTHRLWQPGRTQDARRPTRLRRRVEADQGRDGTVRQGEGRRLQEGSRGLCRLARRSPTYRASPLSASSGWDPHVVVADSTSPRSLLPPARPQVVATWQEYHDLLAAAVETNKAASEARAGTAAAPPL